MKNHLKKKNLPTASLAYCRVDKIDPFLTDSVPRTQKGRTDSISMDGETILVTPYILPYQNSLTHDEKKLLGSPKSIYDDQGFYIYRNKRFKRCILCRKDG